MTGPAPNPHATAEQVAAAYRDPKLANVLYHDWEAGTYDAKWSISYDQRCIDSAVGRFRHATGTAGSVGTAGSTDAVDSADAADAAGQPYRHALELGSGTGFFLLNLM